jgi:transcriptional regulator NrdR family protein
MTNFIVIKKDRTEEEFNIDKILDAIRKAGVSDITAEIVVNKIIERLFKIKSSKLRRLVYKFLKKINKKAADNYRNCRTHYIEEPINI